MAVKSGRNVGTAVMEIVMRHLYMEHFVTCKLNFKGIITFLPGKLLCIKTNRKSRPNQTCLTGEQDWRLTFYYFILCTPQKCLSKVETISSIPM